MIALPLAIAFAIASHLRPEQGLYTAIIAGFLISLLGGSRVQIGGPTGVVDHFGYEGLVLATLMAGAILILLGIFRFGAMIKFIPYPVTTGFTTGIAVIIASGQIKDFFGLNIIGKLPSEFIPQWGTYYHHFSSGGINWASASIALGALILMALLRQFSPRVPNYIVAVILATLVVYLFHLDQRFGVATIESRFAGGIPATGAIARTAANIKTGAHTPLAGMIHALVVLCFMISSLPSATRSRCPCWPPC